MEKAVAQIRLGGGGEGVLGLIFAGVCATGLLGSLPHYSLFCNHIIDPILATLGKK